ncbi:major facilitator superfamily domain-containing protein 6 [Caerostris darwini]|uniref:Major facilitator superfamily domain-containing protein 6 n=1 Tax=Caerostris darwini TaxID=1538125 RepID=A0AAV4SZR8_9ARAC|nr:major facilitator superfamily domain-containing protein 6 [Caerostris darwini]
MVEMKLEENNRGVQRGGIDNDGFVPPREANMPPQRNGPKRDIIDSLCTNFNQDLLISKTFYFFFFSAFGSLFPLLAVYFKQMGMNATQSGFLIGVRPFVEFLAAPFWGSMADRFRKGKIMLLFSLLSWIVFTLALAFIQPAASSCVMRNSTHHVLSIPDKTGSGREKRSVLVDLNDYDPVYEDQDLIDQVLAFDESDDHQSDVNSTYEDIINDLDEQEVGNWLMGIRKRRDKFLKDDPRKPSKEDRSGKSNDDNKKEPNFVVGKSPNTVEYTLNYNQEQHISYVSPRFSHVVYKEEDVREVFYLLAMLIVLGEFFSAPAITLADSATISYLAENADNYGKQRMFGSLGWGLAMFFVGIALDQSTAFPDHPCGPHERERNYTICFATFSVLMGCALIAATQFKFDYESLDDQIPMKPVVQNGMDVPVKGSALPSFLTEGTVMDDTPIPLPPSPKQPEETAPKSTVFAQTTRQLPEWFSVMRTFANLRYGAFLYVTWFMGFGIGLVFTFLFWHLQDLGGTSTLFGVASVINHISEIFAYFFSFKFIRQIGHTKVLCIGLVGNICRFLYISWLSNPWWVLPFEFVQGITHAAVWAACCSYITQATPANLRSSAQGVLQGLHHGLGRGCGAVFGGIFVYYFGTQVTFRGYGFASLIVLILFVFISYYKKDKGFSSFQDDQEPDAIVEETAHLAPHGVPSNPMARSLSKQNLRGPRPGINNNEGGYGTAGSNTAGGFLGVPDGAGGYAGDGQNYTSDFNMNKTPLAAPVDAGGAFTRRALAAAFNPKGILAQAASPEAAYEYEFIRRDFQAYKEVTGLTKYDEDVFPKHDVLVGPKPKTRLYNPQPENRQEASYDW